MHWRIKWLALSLFSLPGLIRIYPGLKQRLVRSVFRSPRQIRQEIAHSLAHVRAFRRHAPVPLARARYFEFGAGRDLVNNLCLWCLGLEQQTVVDLYPLLRAELVEHVRRRLLEMAPEPFLRLPRTPLRPTHPREDLRRHYGIHYRAPCDAAHTGLPPASVDLIATVNTLEHIPPAELDPILAECRRLLRPGGVMSMIIDYSDHYSHFDRAITPYNFLRYSEAAWRRYNPPLHYQNRLRHADYAGLFTAAGFRILEEQAETPPQAERLLARVPLDAAFARRPRSELLPTRGHYVLRRD